MPLIKAVYEARLRLSFQVPIGSLWNTCINEIVNATDDFIKSGTVNTTVTGTVVPPTGFPYTAAGVGLGNPPLGIVTTPTSVVQMKSVLTTLFAIPATVWAQIGPEIAGQINNIVSTATVNTIDSAILVGTGIGTINTNAGLPLLITRLSAVWSTGSGWNSVAGDIASAIDDFLKACLVNTTDSGTTPPNSWAGTGLGSIN